MPYSSFGVRTQELLSTTAQHAVRALSSLATHKPGSAVLGRELAETTGVPASYLAKILLVLNRAGLIEATRGTGGGYRLARRPDEIFLVEIVHPIDGAPEIELCVLGLDECTCENPCALHDWWKEVREGFRERLQQTSLAEASLKAHAPKADS